MLSHAAGEYYARQKSGALVLFTSAGEMRMLTEDSPPAHDDGRAPVVYKQIFGESDVNDPPSEGDLAALGEAMRLRSLSQAEARRVAQQDETTSGIPAGYTYLGQFIFHDITSLLPNFQRRTAREWKNYATPALDLRSVINGWKPEDDPKVAKLDRLLRIGLTKGGSPQARADLPRIPESDGTNKGYPLISDERNDDFLPLAQCHLLLLRFYNAVAITRRDSFDDSDSWWRETRQVWTQHFQYLVLEDYLPKVIDCDVYKDVRSGPKALLGNRRLVGPADDFAESDWFPLEFAGAAGRFGHSMIREQYKPWSNQVERATMGSFLEFSYRNSGDHLEGNDFALRTGWQMDWARMFAVPTSADQQPIESAPIDTVLSRDLFALPWRIAPHEKPSQPSMNLAAKTLLRGKGLRLVSAQTALSWANDRVDRPIEAVPYDDLFTDDLPLCPNERSALSEATPLWYYILREAETKASGRKLGPLGSRIVMESLHAAIAASEDSILAQKGWRPTLGGTGTFSMADLLAFTDRHCPTL
jgi:hypothetical protein